MKYSVWFPVLDDAPEAGPILDVPDAAFIKAALPDHPDSESLRVDVERDGRINIRGGCGVLAYLYPTL